MDSFPIALFSDWDSPQLNCPVKVGKASACHCLLFMLRNYPAFFLAFHLCTLVIGAAGAVAVAEFIAESPRLLRLDLRENEIKTGGLMALSLALKVNTSLLRLDLDREPKKETVSMGKKYSKCLNKPL